MKKLRGCANSSEYTFSEKKQMYHEGIIAWFNKVNEVIKELLNNQEPIHLDYILSRTFDKSISDNFSKEDLVKVLEKSPKSKTPLTYIKILTELIVRFSENEISINHFLVLQELDDLGNCLEILIASERFETACLVRDEINKRIK